MSRSSGTRRALFHFGRQMRADIIAVVMACHPLGVGRRLAVDIVVNEYGAPRRARVEQEIKRLTSAKFVRETGSHLELGNVFGRSSPVI